MQYPTISFDNTEVAFANKSDQDLKDAHWLFNVMSQPWLVKMGTRLTPWTIKSGLPVKGMIRNTIFRQFVGGEKLPETAAVVQKLAASNVKVILDYGVEGKTGEKAFDHATEEFIRVIRYASTQPNIPYMSVKVTGIARFALLEKVDSLMHGAPETTLMRNYNSALQQLSLEELQEWNKVYDRMRRICTEAANDGVGVLFDAEDSWIQDPVDALTILMMKDFNQQKAVVFNTLQLYRRDRLDLLIKSFRAAEEQNFILGAKLVRGAYMEKERKRAAAKGYDDPIQPDKETCDRDYNEAVRFCIDNIDRISVMIASHNEYSNLLGTELLMEKDLPLDHPHVHFSQLYGMSDNITYNLAAAGCSVSKYLPFGPIEDVIPYLMRRAEENTSVGGQTSRELSLIKKELKRRKEYRAGR